MTDLIARLREGTFGTDEAKTDPVISSYMAQAADMIELLRSNISAIEDEKNTYMDYVGDALGQDHDGETLWDAAQRVMSECDRLRAELAACKKAIIVFCDHYNLADTSWKHLPAVAALFSLAASNSKEAT